MDFPEYITIPIRHFEIQTRDKLPDVKQNCPVVSAGRIMVSC